MTSTTIPDHVGELQKEFDELLTLMFTTISNIQRDAAAPSSSNDSNQIKFDQLPQLADQIVEKTKKIDSIIDQANEKTCIGKDIQDIKVIFNKQAESYEKEVIELGESCEEAEKWLKRIHQMLGVIAQNTPWMKRFEPNSDT